MSNTINIKGIDKAAILAALYNASKQQGMGFLQSRGSTSMTVEDAQKEIDAGYGAYFDYLHGRVMKVEISKGEIDPWLYDRDNGDGAAARALAPLLKA